MTDFVPSNPIISSAVSVWALARGNPNTPDETDDTDEATEIADSERRQTSVPVGSHGERLDRALALMVPEFSRSYLQQLIASSAVLLNGLVQTKSAARVKAGDAVSVELKPTLQSQAFKPEPIALDMVFEDEFLCVINKPAGLVVHPAPGNWSGTLLNGLLARDPQAINLPRAGIVHRLDKDTSGLMVVARTRQTMDHLVRMIAARSVSRQYIALAKGAWLGANTKCVDLPIGRDVRNRLRMAVVDLAKHAGKTAMTDVTLLEGGPTCCLVRCKLHTGRTHQIRVHLAALGHPLVSDVLYGGALAGGLERQGLHAWRLAFEHPVTHEPMVFKAAVPLDMQAAIADLGLRYNQSAS